MIEKLLGEFVSATRQAAGEKLRGIYLHGSLAMGCFHEKKSDVDILVVVKEEMNEEEKRRYLKEILRLNQLAPEKGIEMSVVLERDMKNFVHPCPYHFHFSKTHLKSCTEDAEAYIKRMRGTDPDLAAHVTVINRYGKTLFGKEIKEVFGAVSKADYLDAIYYDIEDAAENILKDPVYTILNLSRVLAFSKCGQCFSKKDGAKWALDELKRPELRDIVFCALTAYETGGDMPVKEELSAFAREMLFMIRNNTGIGQKTEENGEINQKH